MKLYQIALKFQSQGPDSFNEAENAYTNLFASEVFTYPESSLGLKPTRPISEVERPDDLLENPLVDASALPATGSDGAPSTLPQILYLSYKNKGQFMLDRLKDSLLHSSPGAASSILKGSADYHRLIATLSSSLRLFADALERDDTDVELWRLVSRICGYLGSQRIARYCLESALTTDESNLNASSEHLSLDQTIATQQLHVLLHAIYDRTSEPQFVFKPKIRSTIATLNKFLDPCPYLPIPWQEVSNSVAEYIQRGLQIGSQEIRVPLRTWTNCGKALMIQFGQDAQHLKGTLSGANYSLVLPAKRNSSEEMTSKQRRIDLTFPKDIIAEKGPLLLENSVTIDSDRNNNSQVDGLIQDTSLPCMVADAYNDVSMRASEVDIRLKDSVHIQQSGSQVPVISNDDDIQTRAEASITIGDTVSLPTRKRSSDSAGMQENADTGRSRSKRIKARGLMAESNSAKDDTLVDRSQHYNDLLQSQHQADYWLFEAVGSLLSKFGADRLGPLASLQEIMSTPQPPDISHQSSMLSNLIDTAARDLRNNLLVWNTEKSNTLIRNDGLDLITSSRNSALTVFLEHSKRETPSQRKVLPDDEGLEAFTEDIRQNWTYLDQLALKWVEALLSPRSRDESQNIRVPSTYEEYLWPETLKHAVVQMLVMKDEFIYIELLERVKILDQRLLESNKDRPSERLQTSEENLIVAVQNIFELHLDVHNSIISPSSEVDVPTRELQLDRLGRWAALARDAITKLPSSKEAGVVQDHLEIRSLWSSVLHISLIDPSARDHIVACFRDLQHILMDAGNPKIELFNNGVMPEVSAAAAESEISRLTTMDFFLGIFSPEQSNHLAVIESLGPILERSVRKEDKLFESTIDVEAEPGNAVEFKGALSSQNNANETDTDFLDSQVQQMLRFLDGANISLKLLLWQKLSDAYGAIKYPPQVLSCNLRCVEIIVDHLELTLYKSSVNRTRRSDLIYWIRILGNIIEKALMQILDVPNVFEFIDEDHLHSSMKAVAACQRLLWIIILWEDSVLVGQTQSSRPSNVPGSTLFDKGFDILHTILVNTWLLQYNLVKEAFEQSNQGSNAYNEYLLDYLKLLHRALGLRHCCNSSNKLFLKYMKGEILRLDPTESSSNDMAQLVYDLYGLKISPIATELENHQCNPASLDRETAFEVMDLVMAQASKTNIKDLGKSELKATIDKMQQAIKVPKPTPMMLFNRRIINNFLKSPINPVDLYRSLKGIGDLNGALVDNVATLGDRGWYFLLGHLSLVKHRSQKRTSAGPIDDLDIATAFFRQDLELGVEKWETWYRLAQVYDAKIEEDVTWTAEKLNNDTGDLRGLQRSAIHCYAIAVAIAIRSADASFETVSKISELYIDFAFRVFSSTREPFSMDAFSLKDFVKHYNGEKRGMYEGRPFCDMQLYPAWKFVCALLRRALVHKSGSWM